MSGREGASTPGGYRDGMACVRPTPTPNPNAMKFTLDITLPERILARPGDAVDDAFTSALLAVKGVDSVFGVNDFVTVVRVPGSDWEPIVCAVQEAAVEHLPVGAAGPSPESVQRARALLRDAVTAPAATPVEIRTGGRHRDDRDGPPPPGS
jgi:Scaffold protein Nfu/NifU N terminal